MTPRTHRAVVAIAVLAASCTAPVQTDAASLPPVTTTTLPLPVTTLSPPTTTSTIAPAGPAIVAWLRSESDGVTLAASVAAWPGVAHVELVSGAAALEEFADLFSDRPELAAGVEADALAASLRLELSQPSFLGEVAGRLRSLSDIDEVVTAVTPSCNPFPDWNVVVFVEDDRDLTRLRNELLAIDGLTDVTVVGRAEAFAEYQARFDAPDDGGVVTVADMAVSLRARTTDPVALATLPFRFETDLAVQGVHVSVPGAPPCPVH